MKDLPKMISTKDAAYLSDMFNWHFVTAQKYDYYLTIVEDEKLEKELNDLVSMHLDFCSTIIKLMEGGIKND